MNVKPGDLSIIIRSDFPENIGHFVTVEATGEMCDEGWEWDCISASPIKGEKWVCGFRMEAEGLKATIPDAWLRPIRDPGDDAKDESTAWLPPVPTREVA